MFCLDQICFIEESLTLGKRTACVINDLNILAQLEISIGLMCLGKGSTC